MLEGPVVTGKSPPTSEQPFCRYGLGYRYEPNGLHFRFTVDNLVHTGDDIRATVICDRRDGDARWLRVHRGKVLMEGSNSKRDYAKQCQEMHDDDDSGKFWRKLVEDACGRVIDAEDEGEPILKVGRLPQQVLPFPVVDKLVPAWKPTVLYGAGGTGKGYIATGVAVAVQCGLPFLGLEVQRGNVLYLDWEDDSDEMDMRVKEVSAGFGLLRPAELAYRVCRGTPLKSQVQFLAEYIAAHNIILVVVDSVEAAVGSGGERSTYEEGARGFFESIRKLGRVTTLLIDHVSEQGRQTKDRTNKMYGSIFKMNWARNCWEARKDQAPGESRSRLALYHTKVNRGPLHPAIGVELNFSESAKVTMELRDVTESVELSQCLPGPDRVVAALRDNDGPMKAQDISKELKEPDNKVRTWLGRLLNRNVVAKRDDKRWELAEASEPKPEQDDIPW